MKTWKVNILHWLLPLFNLQAFVWCLTPLSSAISWQLFNWWRKPKKYQICCISLTKLSVNVVSSTPSQIQTGNFSADWHCYHAITAILHENRDKSYNKSLIAVQCVFMHKQKINLRFFFCKTWWYCTKCKIENVLSSSLDI